MYRRRLLALSGFALTLSIGGCLDSDGDAEDSTDDSPQPTEATENTNESADEQAGEDSVETDWPSGPYADYETTDLRVRTADGETLGAVHVALARTRDQRFLGLSDANLLPEDGGMLFVFDSAGDRTFVMREMDFGIDIIYADENGTITEIHHAPEPGPDEDGNEQRYPGYGQYVLEVSYEWSLRHGISEGDVLDFELPPES